MYSFALLTIKVMFLANIFGMPVLEENLFHTVNNELQTVVNKMFYMLKLNNNFTQRYENRLLLSMHATLKTSAEKKYKVFKKIRKVSRVKKKMLKNKNNLFILDKPIDEIVEMNFKAPINRSRKFNNFTMIESNSIELPAKSKETFVLLREYLNNVENVDLADMVSPIKKVNEIYERHQHFRRAYRRNLKLWQSSNVTVELETRRVFEGHKVRIKKFPFVASVHVRGEFVCTGSIISRDLVLTAASCLLLVFYDPNLLQTSPDIVGVRLGSELPSSGGDYVSAVAVVIHPSFQPATLRNNLAIIRIRKHLHLGPQNTKIRRIQYRGGPGGIPPTVQNVLLLGWGNKDKPASMEMVNDQLSWSRLKLQTMEDCLKIYTDKYVSNKSFCAGFTGRGVGACQRDAGGPALVASQLVGVVSFGPPVCGMPDAPTVFTDIGYYAPWIERVAAAWNTRKQSTTSTQEPKETTVESKTNSSVVRRLNMMKGLPIDYPYRPLPFRPRSYNPFGFFPIDIPPINFMRSFTPNTPKPIYPQAMSLLSYMLKDMMHNNYNDAYSHDAVDDIEAIDSRVIRSKNNTDDAYLSLESKIKRLQMIREDNQTYPLKKYMHYERPPQLLIESDRDIFEHSPQLFRENEHNSYEHLPKSLRENKPYKVEKIRPSSGENEYKSILRTPKSLRENKHGIVKHVTKSSRESKHKQIDRPSQLLSNNSETEEKSSEDESGMSIEVGNDLQTTPSSYVTEIEVDNGKEARTEKKIKAKGEVQSSEEVIPKKRKREERIKNIPYQFDHVLNYDALGDREKEIIIQNFVQNKLAPLSSAIGQPYEKEVKGKFEHDAEDFLRNNFAKGRLLPMDVNYNPQSMEKRFGERTNKKYDNKDALTSFKDDEKSFEEEAKKYFEGDTVMKKGSDSDLSDELILLLLKQTTARQKRYRFQVTVNSKERGLRDDKHFIDRLYTKKTKWSSEDHSQEGKSKSRPDKKAYKNTKSALKIANYWGKTTLQPAHGQSQEKNSDSDPETNQPTYKDYPPKRFQQIKSKAIKIKENERPERDENALRYGDNTLSTRNPRYTLHTYGSSEREDLRHVTPTQRTIEELRVIPNFNAEVQDNFVPFQRAQNILEATEKLGTKNLNKDDLKGSLVKENDNSKNSNSSLYNDDDIDAILDMTASDHSGDASEILTGKSYRRSFLEYIDMN